MFENAIVRADPHDPARSRPAILDSNDKVALFVQSSDINVFFDDL